MSATSPVILTVDARLLNKYLFLRIRYNPLPFYTISIYRGRDNDKGTRIEGIIVRKKEEYGTARCSLTALITTVTPRMVTRKFRIAYLKRIEAVEAGKRRGNAMSVFVAC